jgi:hypothetical protein
MDQIWMEVCKNILIGVNASANLSIFRQTSKETGCMGIACGRATQKQLET